MSLRLVSFFFIIFWGEGGGGVGEANNTMLSLSATFWKIQPDIHNII